LPEATRPGPHNVDLDQDSFHIGEQRGAGLGKPWLVARAIEQFDVELRL
jgi:hypothetical protein